MNLFGTDFEFKKNNDKIGNVMNKIQNGTV